MKHIVGILILLVVSVNVALAQPPTISGFTPGQGPVGAYVYITGTNFSATPSNNQVFFTSNVAATVVASTATTITAVVPAGAITGTISVKVFGNDSGPSAGSFIINNSAPAINGISPLSGPPGSVLTITGLNFDGAVPANNDVKIGGLNATVQTANSTTITAFVPGAVAIGPALGVSVTVGGLTANSFDSFMATAITPPTVSSFTPASGAAGSSVTITGTNFSTTPADNTVYFGASKANVTASTATTITATVPSGATFQPISVMVNGRTAYSRSPFVLTFPGGQDIVAATFSPKVDFGTGAVVSSATAADFNADGKPDIAASNTDLSDNSISVLRNTSSGGTIAFATKVDFSVGASPQGVSVADFDGDGKQDMCVANFNSNSVSVLRSTTVPGSSTISFAAKADFSTGSTPIRTAVADFDGDGRVDIVSVNPAGLSISVLRNTSSGPGNISFAAKVDFTTPTDTKGIAVGDLDGDGKTDIATSSTNGNAVSVFRNTSTSGSVTFATRLDYIMTIPEMIAIGDLDGDAKLDLAVVSYTGGYVSVFRYNGSGPGNISYAAKVDFTIVPNPYSVGIADLDGNGKLDLAVGYGSALALFKNTSTGAGNVSFSLPVSYASADIVGTITGVDIDGDNRQDLVTANVINNSIGVYKNNGDAVPPTITGLTPLDNSVGVQANANLVITFSENVQKGTGDIVIREGGNATQTIPAASSGVSVSGNIVTIDPADFTNNALVNVEISAGAFRDMNDNDHAGIADPGVWNFSVVAGTVPTITGFSPSSGPIGTSVTITGTNFDATSGGIVYFGATKAVVTAASPTQITATVPPGASYLPISVTTNGLTAYSLRPFHVTFPGTANGFTAATFSNYSSKIGGLPFSVAAADLDGDGQTDVVAALNNPDSIGYARLTAQTQSAGHLSRTAGDGPFSITAADLDGDGDLDVATANYLSSNLSVLNNTSTSGAITFGTRTDFTTASVPSGIVAADLNRDGKPDLITSNAGPVTSTISVLKNITSAANSIDFAAKVEYATALVARHVAAGDIDGDGKVDVVTVNDANGTFSVLRNISGSEIDFANKVDIATGTSPMFVAIGDLDGDNKPEIVTAHVTGNQLAILRNLSTSGSVAFAGPAFVTLGATGGPRAVTLADLDGDGKVDLATANEDANNVSVFRNISTGAGTIAFAPKVDYEVQIAPMDVRSGDFNNDGATDLVAVNRVNGTFTLLINQLGAPEITSFDPATGSGGTNVTITGTNFSTVPGNNIVKFNGVTATIVGTPTSTSIVATVPVSATTGKITVEVNGRQAQSAGDFTVTIPVAPSVTGFNPSSGGVGTNVTINGDNFSTTPANNIVRFNGVSATIVGTPATTTIVAAVPAGATTGRISVEVAGLTGTSAVDFTVTGSPAPTISGLNPSSGSVGTNVTITGTNFSTTAANNIVKFNGVVATIVGTPTTTSIVAAVPAGATTGKVSVEVGGLTGTSSGDFTVLATGAAAIQSEAGAATYEKGGTLTVSVTVNDVNNVNTVVLKTRGITEALSALKSVTVTPTGNKFEKIIQAADLTDPVGIIYYFEVTDKQPTPATISSTTRRSYVKYLASSSEQAIPGLRFGSEVSSYQIISVPLVLDNKNVSSVFSALMPYNRKKWRLFDYSSGENREFDAFSTIDAGKGYWFIARTQTTINPGGGQAVGAHEGAPFEINLAAGWNLIGNPYNFNVVWADVLAANPGVLPATTKPQIFADGGLKDGTVLEKYRGAFVFSANAATLRIPVLKSGAGRTQDVPEIRNAISDDHWQVKLTLHNATLSNELGGIGMHPKAEVQGKDDFDLLNVPLPDGLSLADLSFPHPEVFASFSRDIVTTQQNYTWSFDVRRPEGEDVELRWSNGYFGDNDKELQLFDPATLQLIDMRKANRFMLNENTTKLQILFGSRAYVLRSLDHELPVFGNPFPNPASSYVTIPMRVPERTAEQAVTLSIYNAQGVRVRTVMNTLLKSGLHDFSFDPELPAGVYLVRVDMPGIGSKTTKLVIK